MSATFGFSIDRMIAHFVQIRAARAGEREGLCLMCGRRLSVCACDQFERDLRGDHDGPASYSWLTEREAIAAWEDAR